MKEQRDVIFLLVGMFENKLRENLFFFAKTIFIRKNPSLKSKNKFKERKIENIFEPKIDRKSMK